MAEISGLNGLSNVDTFINTFLSVERRPLGDLRAKKSDLERQRAVFSDLRSEFSDLLNRVKGFLAFGNRSKLGTKVAQSSNESIVTAEVTSKARIGINTIFVSKLASRDTVVSDRISNKKNSLASKFFNTTQKFTLRLGSDSPVDISVTFDDKDETNGDVLRRIAKAINDSGQDVTATVIDVDKNSVRLTIVSKETGSTNSLSISDKVGGTILNELGFIDEDDARVVASKSKGGFLKENVDDLDAQFALNGVEITLGTNKIENVIEGLTLNLLKAQDEDDQSETITVLADNDQIKEEIKGFIEDYNSLLKFINAKTRVDGVTGKRGALSGNFTVLQLKFKLRDIASSLFIGDENKNVKSLSDLGIKIDRDGTLKIDDEDAFDKKISENQIEVSNLFNSENGIANRLESELKRFTKTGGVIGDFDKSIQLRIRNIDKRSRRINDRLKGRELSLRQRFISLQRLLTSLNSQQALLRQISFQAPGLNLGFSQPQFSRIRL